ncbi:MAG: methyltransferase domain-containing protein [Alphaproteobacteria bacterium]|nr:methyltransferase domain-containing protein [Alphaproteobacteria bacterium]MCB9699791.1 methyltransferase domain-containing protein [Alphaproteobacteria bacterium]
MPEPIRYRLALRTEVVGGWRFDLTAIEDFEAAVSELAEAIGRGADARWFEELCPMFGVIWPSARALAERATTLPLRGRRVLELGCGLALPSLVAARAGARVVATDQHPDTWTFLEQNLQRNRLSLDYRSFDWAGPLPDGVDERGFDLVMASDVLYAATMPELVAASFDRFLAPDGEGLLADPGRPWLQDFAEAARARGLRVELDAEGETWLLSVRR